VGAASSAACRSWRAHPDRRAAPRAARRHGYPHRLRGDEIPILARIVHVADAFDAITSARAYRPARSAAEALRELWRYAGSQFDAEVVQALASAMPSVEVLSSGNIREAALGPRLAVVNARI
jgi:hypothetical protein